MKKSEKILIALVAAACLYGIVDYILQKTLSDHNFSSQPIASNKKLELISTELNSVSVNESTTLALMVDEIKKPWPKDVFLHAKKQETQIDSSVELDQTEDISAKLNTEAQNFIYSGFLTMGDTTIAILDGLDYRENEFIKGFKIVSISQDAIQLTKDGMTFSVNSKSEISTGLYTNVKKGSTHNVILDQTNNKSTP